MEVGPSFCFGWFGGRQKRFGGSFCSEVDVERAKAGNEVFGVYHLAFKY